MCYFSSTIFIGRIDAEAEVEAPMLWPPNATSQLIGKDPDAGKDGGQEEKGTTEDEMAGWCKLPERLKDREVWPTAVHGVTNSQT